jgi:hypothetical protein
MSSLSARSGILDVDNNKCSGRLHCFKALLWHTIMVSLDLSGKSYVNCENELSLTSNRYAAGATVQILMFSVLACKVKMNAPRAHTYLEIVQARNCCSVAQLS